MASIIQKTKALSATVEAILFSFDKSFKQIFPFSIKKKKENQFYLLHSFIFTQKVR